MASKPSTLQATCRENLQHADDPPRPHTRQHTHTHTHPQPYRQLFVKISNMLMILAGLESVFVFVMCTKNWSLLRPVLSKKVPAYCVGSTWVGSTRVHLEPGYNLVVSWSTSCALSNSQLNSPRPRAPQKRYLRTKYFDCSARVHLVARFYTGFVLQFQGLCCSSWVIGWLGRIRPSHLEPLHPCG